jgi:hypothetical protein
MDVAGPERVVFGISRTGASGDPGALNDRLHFDDMFRIVRTVDVPAFVVLTLAHVVDVTIQVLSEMCCILLVVSNLARQQTDRYIYQLSTSVNRQQWILHVTIEQTTFVRMRYTAWGCRTKPGVLFAHNAGWA